MASSIRYLCRLRPSRTSFPRRDSEGGLSELHRCSGQEGSVCGTRVVMRQHWAKRDQHCHVTRLPGIRIQIQGASDELSCQLSITLIPRRNCRAISVRAILEQDMPDPPGTWPCSPTWEFLQVLSWVERGSPRPQRDHAWLSHV